MAHSTEQKTVVLSKTVIGIVGAIIAIVIVGVLALLFIHPGTSMLSNNQNGGQATPMVIQHGAGAPVLLIPQSSLTYNTSESIQANVSSTGNSNWMAELYVNGAAVAGPAASVSYSLKGTVVGNLNVTARNTATGAFTTVLLKVIPANMIERYPTIPISP